VEIAYPRGVLRIEQPETGRVVSREARCNYSNGKGETRPSGGIWGAAKLEEPTRRGLPRE